MIKRLGDALRLARRAMALATLALAMTLGGAASGQQLAGAVIIQYHRFGEDDVPTTNIRLAQFEAHLAELKKSKYTVLPLADVIAALREGRALPDRTVAITIDDAYTSAY